MIDEIHSWLSELLATGQIVQDADTSVPWPDREQRFKRYVELCEVVSGAEGLEAAAGLLCSLQSAEDYGAYQSTWHALGRFPPAVFISATIRELPVLIARQPNWAGDLLCGLANSRGTPRESDVSEFKRQLAETSDENREIIRAYILSQERQGWLRHRVGVLSE